MIERTRRHALVFGASGFVGRYLVLALDADGVEVTAAVRSHASYKRVVSWLKQRGCRSRPAALHVDFGSTGLPAREPSEFGNITEVYNWAGAYRFGMSNEDARHANVDAVRAVVGFVAGLPRVERLVHVSGYRVGGQDPAAVPWSTERTGATYAGRSVPTKPRRSKVKGVEGRSRRCLPGRGDRRGSAVEHRQPLHHERRQRHRRH